MHIWKMRPLFAGSKDWVKCSNRYFRNIFGAMESTQIKQILIKFVEFQQSTFKKMFSYKKIFINKHNCLIYSRGKYIEILHKKILHSVQSTMISGRLGNFKNPSPLEQNTFSIGGSSFTVTPKIVVILT